MRQIALPRVRIGEADEVALRLRRIHCIPDPALRYDEVAGRWEYTEPDWTELRAVVTGHGPASQSRLEFRRLNFAETQWVRDALLGPSGVAAA